MILSLLALVLVAPLGGARGNLELRVTAGDAGGAEDRVLATSLAQALIDAGLPATSSDPGTACEERCLRVAVRKATPELFVVQVRSRGGQSVQTPLHLDPSASPFDQAHALAIQIEVLADRAARAPKRRRPPTFPSVAASEREVAPAEAAPAAAALTPPLAPPEAPAAIAVERPATVEPGQERLALSVAATSLVGASGGLLMHGVAVGVKVRVSPRVGVGIGISLLRPQRVRSAGISLRREVMPLQLSTTIALPSLSAVRLGAGVEGIAVSGDSQGREMPPAWSLGVLGRAEYRHRIRSFALMAALQLTYHHREWSAADHDTPSSFAIPRWTVAGALGLEFQVL
jgi:hypothetical protein